MSLETRRNYTFAAIAVAAAALFLLINSRSDRTADAFPGSQTAAGGGIMVVPVQTGRDSYGIAMVDTEGQTLWLYGINTVAQPNSRLKLLAARSWKYDRLLEQYNTDEPTPEQVRILLDGLRQAPKKSGAAADTKTAMVEMAEPNSVEKP